MSDVSTSSTSSEPEVGDRGFTPVNAAPKAKIIPEKPILSSKSRTKTESSINVAQQNKIQIKDFAKDVHSNKVKKDPSVKAIQPDRLKTKAKDVTKASPIVKVKPEHKPKAPLKLRKNPFIMTEAKAASKPRPKPKMKSPSPEPGANSGSEDAAAADEHAAELQMKDITNRNKTTVAKLVQALSTRGLPTKGNRADVTARFILYELGLDTTGGDKQMQDYCKELLQASMTSLKETLSELKQNSVGTNKPELVGRILKATYEDEEDSDDGEEESSSEEEEDNAPNQQASKTLATPSTSPDSVANGKKRARVVEEDLEEEVTTPKRRKVVTFEDEIEEPSCDQPKVKKSLINGDKKKRQRSEESDRGSPEVQQKKKLKLTEPKPKPKPQDKDRVSVAEVGRAVRAKPNPATIKPKSKKSKKDDNHFTFNDVLDSRIIFENAQVPANVLSCALKVLTGLGTTKDINQVHDFRHDHALPLYKLYREGKYKSNVKQCPKEYLAAQEFYQEREEELELAIREAEIKEDEEKAKQMAKEQEEMEDEYDIPFDDDEQPDQEMSDDDEDIDDLILAAHLVDESPATDSNGEDLAKIYQQAQIAAYYEEVQKELDDADELRGKSLHASEISYLASIPQGTTLQKYYDNLWEPKSDVQGSKEEKMELRKEEIAMMKMAKVRVGSEEFRKVRLSHDGKW